MRIIALAFTLVVPCSAFGQGGPPMITDDPGTPGDGNWEINIAWTVEHAGSSTVQQTPLLDAAYGVGDRLQLKLEVPWVVANEPGIGSRDGLGNSNLGVKWRFFDAGEDGWLISTFPQVEFRNPGPNSVERGLAEAGRSSSSGTSHDSPSTLTLAMSGIPRAVANGLAASRWATTQASGWN